MSDDPRERADQRTVLMPRADKSGALKVGTQLQEYIIERLLSSSGFSQVYLAIDTKLDRRVAIKEYLPALLAQRSASGDVGPRLPRFEQPYERGLQAFLAEARLLGSFDHPSLVKVFRCWPEHGTAYMAMAYCDGVTLRQWLADLGTPPSEAWLRAFVQPLLQGLQVLHKADCFHRSIEPDNIMMLYDRAVGNYLEQRPQPVLLDFGAARRVASDQTHNPTAILKSGYSPVEQYDADGSGGMRQGPWTDIYALCAVLYTAMAGHAPRPAIGRVVRDDLVPARQVGPGALRAGLAVCRRRGPCGDAAAAARQRAGVFAAAQRCTWQCGCAARSSPRARPRRAAPAGPSVPGFALVEPPPAVGVAGPGGCLVAVGGCADGAGLASLIWAALIRVR
jgi:serine/threonine protein kinase